LIQCLLVFIDSLCSQKACTFTMPPNHTAKQLHCVLGLRLFSYTAYMQHITVGRVVALEIFQSAAPELVSAPGPDANNESVRWMHILDTERPEGLLPGGEFILTTATFLDQTAQATDVVTAANRFLDAVEDTGAVAVAAEILAGRQHVVGALKQAARHRQVPVYILAKRTRFVELTQYV